MQLSGREPLDLIPSIRNKQKTNTNRTTSLTYSSRENVNLKPSISRPMIKLEVFPLKSEKKPKTYSLLP